MEDIEMAGKADYVRFAAEVPPQQKSLAQVVTVSAPCKLLFSSLRLHFSA
jgi:hypothetical protein